MNAITYSLFGYAGNVSNSFPFPSYFRGLSFNMKMAELIYPGWKVHVILDKETYNQFQAFFDYHTESEKLAVDVLDRDDLCLMMLQRMRPIFDEGKYDRVLCRDLDSLLSYRERQAVEYWMTTGRVVHCMTDSVSHNIALMGGMVGFMCKQFRDLMDVETFINFFRMGARIDWRKKGADQDFLNRVVLPRVAGTMVEHYLLGMPQSFRGECYNYVQDEPIADIPPEYEVTNKFIEHIGADGFRHDQALQFFDDHFTAEQKAYYNTIEDCFKEVFYWRQVV